jgi:hypothetical protein
MAERKSDMSICIDMPLRMNFAKAKELSTTGAAKVMAPRFLQKMLLQSLGFPQARKFIAAFSGRAF